MTDSIFPIIIVLLKLREKKYWQVNELNRAGLLTYVLGRLVSHEEGFTQDGSMQSEQTFELTITDYSKRGHGIAFIQKSPDLPSVKVEVIGAVIGDRWQVSLGKKRKGAYPAVNSSRLQASEKRVNPICLHAEHCGGCSWQQLSYEEQLRQKQQRLETLFSPLSATFHLHPMIGGIDPFYYRNKMEFSFSQNKAGQRFLGLMLTGAKGRVLTLKECHLCPNWFIEVIQAVFSWWESTDLLAYHPPSNRGTLRTLTLREGTHTRQKMVILTVSGNHDYFLKGSDLAGFKQAVLRALPLDQPSIFLKIHHAEKGRPSTFYEMHLHGPECIHETMTIGSKSFDFSISPSSFFQPNTVQAEKLYSRVLAFAEPEMTMRLYDLYAGAAVLSTIFASHVKKAIAIELNPYAVCDAQLNIEANQLTNVSIIEGDVGNILPRCTLKPDLVIIDPPRSGLSAEAVKHLLHLTPKKIIYISCNPDTQSRDIAIFMRAGYELKEVQGIDQFPHTVHIETIAVLVRAS